MYPAYVSKHSSKHEKQVIFFMFLNKERWHYLTVKKLSALLRGIMSKHNGDFYCLNCLHSFRTKNSLKLITQNKKVCENKDICK